MRREGNAPIDLHGSDLTNTWMAGGHFEFGFYVKCDFRKADLEDAILINSNFTGSCFHGAVFKNTRLDGRTSEAPTCAGRKILTRRSASRARMGTSAQRLPPEISRPHSWPPEAPARPTAASSA